MHKLLRTAILITFGLLTISIISGCGDDPPEEVTKPPQLEDGIQPSLAITVMVDPPPDSEIDQDLTEFTLRFNEEVVGVIVNGTTATGFGLTWKVVPHMPLGPGQTLNIRWRTQNGFVGTIELGPYSVWLLEPVPPTITSGTVNDRDVDVDPAPINMGGFRFDFNEPITGTIKLTGEMGVDLNWIANVAGQTATLTPVVGQELVNGTTYKVEIDVQDGEGNRNPVTITFVTKVK